MVRNESSLMGLRELAHLARIQTLEGIMVRARCFVISAKEAATRYEIVLDGHGQYAVVDCPVEAELAPRIDEAIAFFAAATRARAGVF